ncbi:MAG: polysaccharide deacetylase family protein, partial [Actinomycetota bacterium]
PRSRRPEPESMLATLIRRSAKAAVLPAGLLARRKPDDIVVLLYHRLGNAPAEIELSVNAFERHLATLASKHEPRSLDGALEKGGVVVTFDDGTRDFHSHALPLLVRYQVPALLYLATGGVNGGSTEPDPLTWDHLAEAVATGLVAIGSHTHGHADLSKATEEQAEEEMRRSKELIEDRLGVECKHFAYPWAIGSPAAERAAQKLFVTAALDGWRVNRRGTTDRYRLARIPILRSDGQFFFRAKVGGRLNAERVLYQAARRGPWRSR